MNLQLLMKGIKMKKVQKKSNLTEVVFILDRSGSMESLEEDTIGGFNSMIQKQKKENVNALVTTVLFDDEIDILHDRVQISDIPKLTSKEYYARGTTALLDAIGSTIKHISNIHKYARKSDIPEKTLFVITTDGYENASKHYTIKKIKSMVETQKSEYGWNFLFLGANIDAIESASKIGIDGDYAANIIADKKGTNILYQSVSDAVCCCCKAPSLDLPKNWKKKIDEDYKKRNKTSSNSDEEPELPMFLRTKGGKS